MGDSKKKLLVNLLSMIRGALIVPILVFLVVGTYISNLLAIVLFFIAVATDVADGRLARHYNIASERGIFMDSLMDKFLLNILLVYFGLTGWIPMWMVLLNVAREVFVQSFRWLSHLKGSVQRISWVAKSKTVLQEVTIAIIMMVITFNVGAERFVDVALLSMILALVLGYSTMVKLVYVNRGILTG